MNQRIDVLLVEDDPDCALLLGLNLNEACGTSFKFCVQCAETVSAGLALLEKERFDIIILDLMLPDSQGLDTLTRMKTKARDIPIVVLTGLDDEAVGLEAVAQGAQDFLFKERLDPGVLRRALSFALERGRFSSQLEAIIGQSVDGMVVVDEAGTVRYVNPAAETLFGKPKSALIGLPFGFPVALGKPAELRLGGPENERIAEMRVTDVDWHKQSAKLACIRDITALRKLEQIRAEVKERRRVDHLKDQVLSTVSHELRSPLTVVTAAVANLRDGLAGPLSEAGLQMVEIAGKNLDRLARIVNNVLDFSRLESGRATVNRRSIDLREAVEDAVKGVKLACPSRAVALEADVPLGLPAASADPDMVAQVLHNLLDNAVRYARRCVKVTASAGRGELVISVCDDGPGVPAARAGELFDKFVQLQRPQGGGGYKGTGLGLAICHEIVRLNGGRIWVEPGAGGRFHFSLPRMDRQTEESRHARAQKSPDRR